MTSQIQSIDEQGEHRELAEGTIKSRLEKMEEGDKILFNDRVEPLTVTKLRHEEFPSIYEDTIIVIVTGPRGGEYKLSWKDRTGTISNCRVTSISGRNLGHQPLRWVKITD